MGSNKMREEFEAAYISGAIRLAEDAGNVRYEDYHMQQAWVSWQASRADLVVKMPVSYSPQFQDSWVMDQEDIENALKDAGISYE